MGADGGIYIKKINGLNEEEKALLSKHMLNSVTYVQKMGEDEFLTTYRGDNLPYADDCVDLFANYYDPEKDDFKPVPSWMDGYNVSHFMKYATKTERKELFKLAKKLEEIPSIYWEVWT